MFLHGEFKDNVHGKINKEDNFMVWVVHGFLAILVIAKSCVGSH